MERLWCKRKQLIDAVERRSGRSGFGAERGGTRARGVLSHGREAKWYRDSALVIFESFLAEAECQVDERGAGMNPTEEIPARIRELLQSASRGTRAVLC